MALAIEASGKAFYRAALPRVKDPSVKAVYEHLAVEEDRHAREFTQLLASLTQSAPEAPPEGFREYLDALLESRVFSDEEGARQKVLEAQSDMEAVQLGMAMEKDTILFFAEVRDLVRREDRAVVERILQEERQHLRRLALLRQELMKLKKGK